MGDIRSPTEWDKRGHHKEQGEPDMVPGLQQVEIRHSKHMASVISFHFRVHIITMLTLAGEHDEKNSTQIFFSPSETHCTDTDLTECEQGMTGTTYAGRPSVYFKI